MTVCQKHNLPQSNFKALILIFFMPTKKSIELYASCSCYHVVACPVRIVVLVIIGAGAGLQSCFHLVPISDPPLALSLIKDGIIDSINCRAMYL